MIERVNDIYSNLVYRPTNFSSLNKATVVGLSTQFHSTHVRNYFRFNRARQMFYNHFEA